MQPLRTAHKLGLAALVGLAPAADITLATGEEGFKCHGIADLEAVDMIADTNHTARSFMPNDTALGRQIFTGISFDDLKPTLEKMLKAYQRHRLSGETFQKFTLRHDLNTLQAFFSNDE